MLVRVQGIVVEYAATIVFGSVNGNISIQGFMLSQLVPAAGSFAGPLAGKEAAYHILLSRRFGKYFLSSNFSPQIFRAKSCQFFWGEEGGGQLGPAKLGGVLGKNPKSF